MVIDVGSNLIASGITDENGGGFAEVSTSTIANVVAKSSAYADFNIPGSLVNYQQKTIVD